MMTPAIVLFVADVERLTTFYRELAAMQVVERGDGYVVLEVPGFQLVLHAMRGAPLPPDPVTAREDSYWKLCLPVTSLAVARVRAAELGGFLKPTEHEWSARDFRACDGHDPEGNVLQLREVVNVLD